MALSQQEILKVRKQLGIPEQGLGSTGTTTQNNPTETVARRRLMASQYDAQQEQANGGKNFFQRVVERDQDRLKKSVEVFKKGTIGSEQSPIESSLQTVGQGAGFVGDIIGEGLKSILNVIPEN